MIPASLEPATLRFYPNQPVRYGVDRESAKVIGPSEQTMTLWHVDSTHNVGTITVVHINDIYDDVIEEDIKETMTDATSQMSAEDAISLAEGDLQAA